MTSKNAEVRYLNEEWKGRDEIPRIGSRDTRRANTSKHSVTIDDARGFDASLDVNGFQLVRHRPAPIDFHDAEQVKHTYYPEIESVARRVLEDGGSAVADVFFTQHVVRTEDTSDFNKAYARFVHCDYSLNGARGAANKLLEEKGCDPASFADADFVWLNSWQPIERPAIKNPLSVIDASSLATGDVVDYYYVGFGKDNLTSMPVFNPAHRFYYFPEMQTDELLLIKQLDTRDGVATACPHTSFENHDAPAEALPRRSIEVRFMCAVRPG